MHVLFVPLHANFTKAKVMNRQECVRGGGDESVGKWRSRPRRPYGRPASRDGAAETERDRAGDYATERRPRSARAAQALPSLGGSETAKVGARSAAERLMLMRQG